MEEYDLLIQNSIIVDGSSKSAYKGSIAVLGDRVTSVGFCKSDAKKVIDASGFPRCYSAMINDSIGTKYYNNCIFSENKNIVYIMAIQNIKEDEELFISYGIDYWRKKLNNNHYDAYENTCKKLRKKPNDIQLKKEREFLNMK